MNQQIKITGISIDNLNYDEILNKIDSLLNNNSQNYIVTVNPEMVLEANHNPDFYRILQKSAINTADGVGILWAAYFLSRPKYKSKILNFCQLIWSLKLIFIYPKAIKSVLKERITGADLLPKIIEQSRDKNFSIFFLGAEEGIAKVAMDKFSQKYPQANFVGSYAGFSDIKNDEKICQIIKLATPDILFVAYGFPKQEFWISRNLHKLSSVKLAIGVGGAFDFYAEKIKRAPKFLQAVGLEWLWRLFRQPSRIVRIWNATFRFIKLIMKNKNAEVK